MRFGLRELRSKVERLIKHEEGQDLVEYALIIALISVAAVTTLHNLASKIVGTFSAVTSAM